MAETDGRTRSDPMQPGPEGRPSSSGDRGKKRIANRLDRAGDRLKRRADTLEREGGAKRQAGQAAQRAGDLAERGASYLRSHDVDEMRADLEVRIRDRPLASIAVALSAGFVIGRLFG